MAAHDAQAVHKWWKEAVVYQVYPSSFLSTGAGSEPGWGDIKGITSKLDYLKDLGVDIVWTSPIYRSPQADMGYDIADYKDIDPRYGTLADVDELIAGLKQRGMKLMMDLVANHTSDQHAWFLDSRSAKDSKHRDWYIWQPPKYDEQGKRQPPNNWGMLLGEANSAWTWDEKTQEYYLSLFTSEQPDLNWENPQVRAAVHDVLRFWLDRGASGFRCDVINLISKYPGFPDAPIKVPGAKYQPGTKWYVNGPRLHEFLQEINKEVLSKYDTITVGEMPHVSDENEIIKVVGHDRHELNMIFIFDLVDIDNVPGNFRMTLQDWKPKDLRHIVSRWQKIMIERGGWNSVFIENHDNPRSVSRYCDDSPQYRELGAKLLALMQTTLSGTLYVYQGEELGMANVPLSWKPEEYKDVETINYWKKMNDLYPGDEEKLKEAKIIIQRKARDHARTPVQWTSGANAGFCKEGVEPWMRVNDDYRTVNAAAQTPHHHGGVLGNTLRKIGASLAEGIASTGGGIAPVKPTHDDGTAEDEHSVWQFWQRGLKNRKDHKDVFVYGDFELLDDQHDSVFAYRRFSETEAFVTVLNFSGKDTTWEIPPSVKVKKWVAGNYFDASHKAHHGKLQLKAWEGILAVAAP